MRKMGLRDTKGRGDEIRARPRIDGKDNGRNDSNDSKETLLTTTQNERS